MAAVSSYSPVAWTYAPEGRQIYQSVSLTEYEAASGGSTMTVDSAFSVGLTRVRLLMQAGGSYDSTWTTTGNFSVTGTGNPTISSATVGPRGEWIDLVVSSMTAGQSYTAVWSGLTGVTAGSDSFTAAVLPTGKRITVANGATGNVVCNNIVSGGSVVHRGSDGNSVSGNVGFEVVT